MVLKHKDLVKLIEDEASKILNSDYDDVTSYTEVRRLTRVKMLKRMFDLQQEIQSFFASKSKSIPEFVDKSGFVTL